MSFGRHCILSLLQVGSEQLAFSGLVNEMSVGVELKIIDHEGLGTY